MSLDVNLEIAKAFNVSPDEAWKIKNMALESWPRNLDDVRRLFPQILEEDENVKLIILALFSLKLRNPEERVMGIIIESNNSAGKSHFAKSILKPLRPLRNGEMVLEFTRMTGAYLERKFKDVDLDRRILFIQETRDAPSQLHLSLSEGKLRVGLLVKNNGDFQPIEIEAIGQPFLVATTTNWSGSPDLIHRCILMGLDESAEQTFRITGFQAKYNSDFIFKEGFTRFVEGCAKLFKKLWENAPENVDVVIPYLPLIEEKLRVKNPNPDIKLRRDFNKLIALIKASAIIFHKHRRTIKLNGKKIIIADLKDFEEILPLFKTSLKQTLANLSDKEEKILNALKEEGGFSNYNDLAKITGIPSSTIRHHIVPRLEAKGCVIVDKDTRPHRIEIVKEPEDVEIIIEEATARKMIEEATQKLLSFGGQMTNREISEETALIPENKPMELATLEAAKSLAVFFEEKGGKGLDCDWPNGQKKKCDAQICRSSMHLDSAI